jgi:DNA ligase-1
MVEWKYDGIRGQVVKRGGKVWIWSRGEELVTERFPEIVALAQPLPDGTVIDGEILVWKDEPDPEDGEIAGRPAPFSLLQQRIGRKNLTKKVLADAPVSFMAYDLLEQDGEDVRGGRSASGARGSRRCWRARGFLLSPVETASSWLEFARKREAVARARRRGLHAQALDAAYGTGRTKAEGLWWKWKIDPMTIDCVLVYAQAGHGRRASVYTDYTFAVWNRPPASKAEADAVLDAIAAQGAGAARRAAAGGFRQGLLGPDRRGVPAGRRHHPQEHDREVRAGAQRQAEPGVRAGLRRHQPQQPATRAASRCASRACCASGTTSRCTRPTRCRSLELKTWNACWGLL